jgi:Fis family transcriptional regulator
MTKNQKLKTKDIFGDYDDKFSIKNFLESKLGNILGDLCHLDNSNLYDTIIQEVEKALFILVLNETGNNQVKTARILGINRNTLSKKLKNYNLI